MKLSESGRKLLFVVIIFGIMPALANAEADVTIQNVNIGPGESTTLPIMINNVSNLIGAHIVLEYNSSIVHVTNIVNGFGLETYKNIDNINGTTRYAVLSLSSQNGNIQFATVTLNAVAGSGNSPLNLNVVSLNNGTGEIQRQVHNGTFTIIDNPPIISSVTADKTNVIINEQFNVTVTASDPDIGDTLQYQFDWENNGTWSPNQSSNIASHAYPAAGTYTINVRVWDNHGASVTDNSLVISVSSDGTPPNIADQSANPGEILLEEPTNIDYAHMSTMLNLTATDVSGISMVRINLSSIGGSANSVMTNTGDSFYSIITNATGMPGQKALNVNATDIFGNSNISVSIPLKVSRNGDVDGNGVDNLNDAIYLANHALHVPGFEVINELSSEVDGSGIVNLNDAIYLANHALHVPGYEMLK